MADTSHQPDNHVHDQIDAYALGLLEDEAAAEVERHIEHCQECQHALRQSREITALLALAPRQVAPPARLKARLMDRIAQEGTANQHTTPGTRPADPAAPAQRPTRVPRQRPDEAAPPTQAIPLPAVEPAAPGRQNWWNRLFSGRAQTPPDTQAPGTPTLPTNDQLEAIVRLLHAPHTAIWELAGTPEAPHAHARLLGSPDENTAVLLVQGLPPLPPERDYQLWFLRDGKPLGSAIFDVRQNGQGQLMIRAPRQLAHYDLAAITPEPAGGSPGPTGPIVIAGQLKAA